jgi:hypothetical protein
MKDSAPARRGRQTRTLTAETPDVSQDAVARRAFELYRARNGQPGDPLSDWLLAERELKNQVTSNPAPRARRSKTKN